VAAERVSLEVLVREQRGSAAARRLRKTGFIPGVIYGGNADPTAISVADRELRKALTTDHGLNAIMDVKVNGETRPVILKEYQRDPISGRLAHVDLVVVRLDRVIQTAVTVEVVGESPGAKEGGVLQQVAREITVEALPMEVPDRIEADVSGLAIGDSLRLGDLQQLEGVQFVDDPETVIATVTVPTRVEEPEEELEEGEEGEEGEGVLGEEGAEGEGETPAEPDAETAGESDSAES
jgi:large subunit ribosomal protein L25